MAKIKKSKMKNAVSKQTIGIIGGCGVWATLNIEKEIIQATQRLIFPLVDQGHPNIMIYQQFHDRKQLKKL